MLTGGDTAVHTAVNVIFDVGVNVPPSVTVYSIFPVSGFLQLKKTNPALVPGLGAVCACPVGCVVVPPPEPPFAFQVIVIVAAEIVTELDSFGSDLTPLSATTKHLTDDDKYVEIKLDAGENDAEVSPGIADQALIPELKYCH